MKWLHYQATHFIFQYGMIPYDRTEDAEQAACGQIQTLHKLLFSVEKINMINNGIFAGQLKSADVNNVM